MVEGPDQPQYRARLWAQFKDIILERLAALEEAAVAVERGALAEDLRRQAEIEAHRLAGSLGSIGFPDGTRIAREIEALLHDAQGLSAPRLTALTAALRQTLERPPT